MPAMGNMDVFNALVEFESQISCYKRVAGVSRLCFVNKAQVICSVFLMLLFVVDIIINEHTCIESVYLVCLKLFCLRNDQFFTLHYL